MSEETAFGLEENVAGALCYLLGFVTGILFLLVEEENDFVRFHAVQSTIVFLALFVLSYLVSIVLVPVAYISWALVSAISSLISAVAFILWVLLMYKAYNGEKYKIPVAGVKAEEYLSR